MYPPARLPCATTPARTCGTPPCAIVLATGAPVWLSGGPERVRFDFNFPAHSKDSELIQIEALVNPLYRRRIPCDQARKTLEQAIADGAMRCWRKIRQRGAHIEFADQRGRGSYELCGGTHAGTIPPKLGPFNSQVSPAWLLAFARIEAGPEE